MLMLASHSEVPGGHRVQQARTTEALRELGIDVVEQVLAEDDEAPHLDGVDVVHGWWPSLRALRKVREHRVPVVLSSVYWPRSLRNGHGQGAGVRHLLGSARAGLSLARTSVRRTLADGADALLTSDTDLRLLFESADLLLPNSEEEGRLLQQELRVSTPVHVVPNAADTSRFSPGGAPWDSRSGVLCVARLDPLKNQLTLVRALSQSTLTLTLAGADHPHVPRYGARVRRGAGGRTCVLGPKQPDELAVLYRQARVHVLPSWYETTGLASLEAALSGCNVVTTERGHASAYFGDLAYYVDPSDSAGMRAVVEQAHETPPRRELESLVRDRFTWAQTARATVAAYRRVTDASI